MTETTGETGQDRRLRGPVRIVGAGLLGASIGLGLREHGVDVILDDASPSALALAVDYGAGRVATEEDDPQVVVVAVPPDVVGGALLGLWALLWAFSGESKDSRR